ncbi:MAG: hypothetical protein WKG07_40750 [Hymenobacter sp.]
MLETGAIALGASVGSKKHAARALYKFPAVRDLQGMPYFSQFAVEELPKIINDPEALGHLRVYTTIDPDLQKAAYEIVNKRLEKLDKYFPKKPKGSLQAALVSIRPKTGEIVAMVGGRDFLKTQFNRATDAQRQPGSVFQAVCLCRRDKYRLRREFAGYYRRYAFSKTRKSFHFRQRYVFAEQLRRHVSAIQEMTLRDALVKSKNVITVDLGMELNIGKVMNLAHKAGLPKVEKAYPSMALGTAEATPLQVATAYTIFANLGDRSFAASD